MKIFNNDPRFEAKIVSLVLAVFMIISILSSYFSSLNFLPENWELPVILAALIMIIMLLSNLYLVKPNVDTILEKMNYGHVKKYDRYDEYYKDLAIAMKAAKHTLDLTHIRNEAPTQFEQGKKYFDSVEKWCNANPSASVRRLTAVNNEEMLEWAKELAALDIRCRNYYTKIANWQSDFPMINFAIVDNSKVFIAITGEVTEKTSGILIEDPAATNYFRVYFENIWSKSQSIGEYFNN